mmetsp:Transcript_17695/g.37030  ORF Transcript_17695/g.37030 Transcript_17695/m.37030 type:complete len:213 (-) Transcript_17695:100-738(-)
MTLASFATSKVSWGTIGCCGCCPSLALLAMVCSGASQNKRNQKPPVKPPVQPPVQSPVRLAVRLPVQRAVQLPPFLQTCQRGRMMSMGARQRQRPTRRPGKIPNLRPSGPRPRISGRRSRLWRHKPGIVLYRTDAVHPLWHQAQSLTLGTPCTRCVATWRCTWKTRREPLVFSSRSHSSHSRGWCSLWFQNSGPALVLLRPRKSRKLQAGES